MRMSAETMKRNGVVLACVRECLENGLDVSREQVALLSGYSEQQVKAAMESLEKQKMLPEQQK